MPGNGEPQYYIFVDGSSRGNPGPAGVGVAVFSPKQEETVVQISKYIGITTNNVAEYEAVIHALKWMVDSGAKRAVVKLDSELVYKQMIGKYRVKSAHISILMKRIRMLRSQIDALLIDLIPREENKLANRLAQKATKPHKVRKKEFKQRDLIT
jgi:ribonuclease HI